MDAATDIPKVTGRHRNRALAAERRRRAVELALGGSTYEQIATEMGYAHRGTVYRLVKQALGQRQLEEIDHLRELELRRLDELQAALWGDAVGGDIRAACLVLKVMDRRSRLLGLYERHETSGGADDTARPRAVVVDPAELVACQGWPVEPSDR